MCEAYMLFFGGYFRQEQGRFRKVGLHTIVLW